MDINGLDNYENTPLHPAVINKNENERIQIANIICQYGANVDLKNLRGETPLHLAV